MRKILAYLGPVGTYSYEAASRCLLALGNSQEWELHALPTIPHILTAVAKGSVDAGLVPGENSIEGTINITLDMLAHELSLYIQGETVLNINHCLLSHSQDLREIHTVLSHPQALAQCRKFIQQKLPQAQCLPANSTAEAVQNLASMGPGTAAIASRNTQRFYNVPILVPDIGDYPCNQTRFLLVGRTPCPHSDTKKTSLVLALEKDRPGGLYEVLGEFARQSINLTKIESRPAKKELGNYIFFIDCEAGHNHPGLQEVLKNLEKKTALLKNLGSYNLIS
ncbi:MAG: prephenate dehydratase [Bacillota bacterium]